MGISIGALLAGGYSKGQRAGREDQRTWEMQDAATARQSALDKLNQKIAEERTKREQETDKFTRANDTLRTALAMRAQGYVPGGAFDAAENAAKQPTIATGLPGGMATLPDLVRLAELQGLSLIHI